MSPPGLQELADGHAGLLGVGPVGVVDFIAELGRLGSAGLGLQQPQYSQAIAMSSSVDAFGFGSG